jgi:F0F1-type ATP synthase membrane subunit b/b'
MEMIIGIFQSLGVDQTIFIQFGVVFIFYLIISPLLFKKLLFVIQEREDKTVKLAEEAVVQAQSADALLVRYKDEVAQAYRESQVRIEATRSKVKGESVELIHKEEQALQNKYLKAKEHSSAQVEQVKSNLMKSTDELSQSLIDKIIN